MNGGFHLASDVNRLYTSRTKGGRGITSIEDMYEPRTIGIMKHPIQKRQVIPTA